MSAISSIAFELIQKVLDYDARVVDPCIDFAARGDL